jgi:hypothetical protein
MLRRSEAQQIRAAAVAGNIAELDRILAGLVPEPVRKFPRDHVLAVVLGRNVYQCQGDECEMVQTSPGYCAACRPTESESTQKATESTEEKP